MRITPDGGSLSPAATSLFSYRRNGVTVTEASVLATTAGSAQQMIVSASGGFSIGAANAIMSGLAIANPSPSEAAIQLSVASLAGGTLGSAAIQLAANGHRALFLDEVFAGSIAMPFEGTLSISSSAPIVVTGLRGQYNERGDFLISATPVFDERSGTVFAHVADGAGFSTRFIFVARQGSLGASLRLVGQNGAPLPLELRE